MQANYDWLVEPKYPLIPGHEGIGKVVALGEGCTRLKIGDRVAYSMITWCLWLLWILSNR
nr:alcohol dehydrogenase catalytic domain-containing protein [Mycoplasmopsis bovis]